MVPKQASIEDRIIYAIDVWAERQPSPDEPAVALGNRVFSPRQLASEVKNHTPEGNLFLSIVEKGAQEFSLDEVLGNFLGALGSAARHNAD